MIFGISMSMSPKASLSTRSNLGICGTFWMDGTALTLVQIRVLSCVAHFGGFAMGSPNKMSCKSSLGPDTKIKAAYPVQVFGAKVM